ncbi:hypothetical protein PHET_09598 [Paragonimus heterotremus]|uniref:Uncharacterized protein n=1 Tax=Paragonimus heterotremus TaxID=100268 RepID=A0A8J4T9S7_9TREM|nr:hypothetical protein PHET_09598 [Paragonimus heterotremus]
MNRVFRVTRFFMEHNRPRDVIAAQYKVSRRRLTDEEMNEIRPWLLNGTVSFNVTQYIRNHFDKKTTTKDMYNLRARVFAKRSTVGYLGRLHVQLNTVASAILVDMVVAVQAQICVCLLFSQLSTFHIGPHGSLEGRDRDMSGASFVRVSP